LLLRPEQGALIQGGRGLRKIRWTQRSKGKRGGARVIYNWYRDDGVLFMLYVYSKSDQGDLTATQVKNLARLVREEFK
jgi:hypothetical protein